MRTDPIWDDPSNTPEWLHTLADDPDWREAVDRDQTDATRESEEG